MRSGHLSAELRGADLIRVRWGELEIASAIHVTVRDDTWGTAPPILRRADLEERTDGFGGILEASHGDERFSWRGTVRAFDDGTLEMAMEGIALRDFVYRRIGICVLHPCATYVGAAYEASGIDGVVTGRFPEDIAAQARVDGAYLPMIPAFRHLIVDLAGGVRATFAFDGEANGFELEDQRNWTDASFKTYPTPLRHSEPRMIRRGERLRQRLLLHLEGPPPQQPAEEGPTVIRIGKPDGHVMPLIGVSAPPDVMDTNTLSPLVPAHLRVPVTIDQADALRRACTTSETGGIPLEVVLLLEEDGQGVERLAPALSDAPLARLIILRRDGTTTGGRFVGTIRRRLGLGSLPILGGTSSHFSELNRSRPDPQGLDGLALSMTPQVHATDERSMMETLEVQTQIVRQVRSMSEALPVVISPVTLAPHDTMLDGGKVDERIGSAFGVAWTAGSTTALASAGVGAITLHERVDRTILASSEMSRVVSLLARRQGRTLRGVRRSRPDAVTALAVVGMPTLLVNLTPEPQTTSTQDAGEPIVRRLEPYEVVELGPSSR